MTNFIIIVIEASNLSFLLQVALKWKSAGENKKMDNSSVTITEMLIAWNEGNSEALEHLMPLVEGELRRIARRLMNRENSNHTLQTTALVNEAYMKLIDQRSANWQNRLHFYALAAKIMRRILLNHARDRVAQKRGGGTQQVALEEAEILSAEKSRELLALDEALKSLAKVDPLKSRLVELRYFGGLSISETAKVLEISPAAVSKHWQLSRAWLKREILSSNNQQKNSK